MAERDISSISEYPNNSYKAKKEKQVNKIVKGKVVKKKKNVGKRIAEDLTTSDTGSVFQYILYDVVIPTTKDLIANIITGGIEMLLFGEDRDRKTIRDRDKTYVSYSSCYNDRKKSDRYSRMNRKAAHIFDDLIFESRREAEDVLTAMSDILDEYNMVTVADLYDLVGTTTSFTDYKWGWENLSSASVVRGRSGYSLRLPRTVPLD